MSSTSAKHPKGLYLLFFTEMWERFSYYGMRAILALYMVKALLFDKEFAASLYGDYTGLVYLTPLIGGYVADRYWGNRRSILIGGLLMALGQFSLFASGSMYETVESAKLFFYLGLGLLIVGNGFFKPNISTMVGSLYSPDDKRKDSAFTIFYMGINLGAFLAPLVCGGLGDTGRPEDFKWGFLAAGVGMLVGVVLFESLKNKYIISNDGEPLGMPIKKVKKDTSDTSVPVTSKQIITVSSVFVLLNLLFIYVFDTGVIGSLIFSSAIAAPMVIFTDKGLTKIEKDRIWVIFVLAFFVIFFWSAFEQAGASLTFFADEQTDRNLFGSLIPASYFQSINPLAIFIFAPLFAWLWLKLGKRGFEPSSPLKMAMGLILLSLGYLVIAFGVKGVDATTKVSMFWLVSMYVLHTFGELCLSPIGLSMVTKLSPIKFSSLLMGIWFMANAAANKLAGVLSGLYPPGPGEFKRAAEINIDLPAMLNGDITATKEQINTLKDMGLSHEWPSIFGAQIDNLYSFFMIFVAMSLIAAVVLFVVYKRLQGMMHGRD